LAVTLLNAGEGKHVVEFRKLSGSSFSFGDLYLNAKDYFGGHVNAKL